MDNYEIAARLTVLERAAVSLAATVAELRQELIDEDLNGVLDSNL